MSSHYYLLSRQNYFSSGLMIVYYRGSGLESDRKITIGTEHKLAVSENRVLRKIFGLTKREAANRMPENSAQCGA
jgi:hypothetical protein